MFQVILFTLITCTVIKHLLQLALRMTVKNVRMIVLNFKMKQFPNIDTLHFQSDGPTAQYKNKVNFCMFVNLFPKLFPKSINATWNFLESRHDQRLMDGIEGTIKWTADSLVHHGKGLDPSRAHTLGAINFARR